MKIIRFLSVALHKKFIQGVKSKKYDEKIIYYGRTSNNRHTLCQTGR